VRELLQRGWARLAGSSESARLDAELLLAHALRQPRSYLLSHDDEPVAEATIGALPVTLLHVRCRGEPLAYLTGEREFWSLALTVTPAVLIPRPETELAVERCLALHDASPAAIADLGTGSGAIALALAVERPHWRIMATDFDAGAAGGTRQCRAARPPECLFSRGDWFTPLQGRQFDLIVSNPPYVAAADPALLALRYEPAAALTPGTPALEALRNGSFCRRPAICLAGGWLVLEHGAGQAADVAGLLVGAGFARVRCHV
jgi:release factor glutamine methyltransferase